MEHNKVYFTLHYSSGNIAAPDQLIVDNVGLVVNNFNFRRILGNLYYKYNAFAIKLESFNCRNVNTNFCLFHIAGLNFVNGYDSSSLYNYSRVMEVLDFSSTSVNITNFISSCNSIMFYKPTSDTLNLTFFFTEITDGTLLSFADDSFYVFSITGIDAYKTNHPQKPIVKRLAEIRTINFTLQSYKAEVIDDRNRAYKFKNINLRNIIGNDYDKYSKFCLISKQMNFVRSGGTSFQANFSGHTFFQLWLSGLDFMSLSRGQYSISTNAATANEISSIHQSTAACAALGSFNSTAQYENYIENAFYKSSEVVDIIISYNSLYGFNLVPANPNNTIVFPQFTMNFVIIPIID